MAELINEFSQSKFIRLSPSQGTLAYKELREAVTKAGILDRDYAFYTVITIFILGGFFISTYSIFTQHSFLGLFLWIIIFCFFGVQIGGLLHDAGHRSIFKNSRMNDIYGTIVATIIFFSYKDWKIKHNTHHAHPNQDEGDPDIEIPFSFTDDRYKGRKGLVGFMRKYQAYFYFPLGSLVLYRLRVNESLCFIKNFRKLTIDEKISYFVGFFCWFILPFLIFDPLKAIFVILLVHLISGFYLLNVFAPNHKGMVEIGKGVRLSFAEQQVITSRNIHGHWITDFMYFGLNYQIEHHLFPNTPRNKLRLLTPFVKAFCRKYRIGYTVVSYLDTNKIILGELNSTAKKN